MPHPIIDAHHHLWQFSRFDYGWITEGRGPLGRDYLPADLKRTIDAAGVSQTVLVQTFHSVAETRWFLEMADQHVFIAGVVGWVDLTDPAVGDLLDDLRAGSKLVGIRHVVQGEPDDDWVVRQDVRGGLEALARRNLPFDLLFLPRHLKHVPTLARRMPDLPMVIDHIAKPPIQAGRFDRWREDMAAAAEFPNVYCKLSGMITEADHDAWKPADLKPYVDHVVDCFGFDRLMFGSDWPVCLLAGSYQQVLDSLRQCVGQLSEVESAALYHETARRFYRLRDPVAGN